MTHPDIPDNSDLTNDDLTDDELSQKIATTQEMLDAYAGSGDEYAVVVRELTSTLDELNAIEAKRQA